MARGGINKANVQKARDALIARGVNPSITAVRVELGNTGSMTTISRYLAELGSVETAVKSQRQRLGDELTAVVGLMVDRLMEEGAEQVRQQKMEFDQRRAEWEEQLVESRTALSNLQREHAMLQIAADTQSQELSASATSLQIEITRNALLSQRCTDQEVRIEEKDGQIQSLEEKHQHAREALEHYRTAAREQREQDQRRHEGQLQQLQVEARQLRETLAIKHDELTHLNRDNERILAESRQYAKAAGKQEDVIQRITAELTAQTAVAAKAEGEKERLIDQLSEIREDQTRLRDLSAQAHERTRNAELSLAMAYAEIERFQKSQQAQVGNRPL